ncbi:MAG: 23S rRNA (uracil(1939)-C(5))-methyltransferase RlmD [candidate division Zixibacteria bacterium CG_4_9_14_3_um_filter_46_8]|nr:MAG: 23S rRNA (uracil(1939)-C(5))-methyltransferase RlmD [candidate division Zixibacteria bacterium CG_4_9_14_3_um_filter_46_8]
MPLPKFGEQIKIEIESLAFGGMGVGKLDDLVVFVDGALPGESITAQVYRRKNRFIEARLLQIESESPDRVKPRCRHFPLCGGCRLQHLSYPKQAEYKKKQLIDSLRQIGRFEDPPVSNLVPSDRQYYYRNKMEYSFGLNADKNIILGLHSRGHYDQVFDLEECFLQSPESPAIIMALRNAAQQMGLPVYDLQTHRGILRYCVVREGKYTDQRMLNIVTSTSSESQIKEMLESLPPGFPAITSVVNNVNTKKATIARGEYENLVRGTSTIMEEIDGIKYRISANSFFQTNPFSALLLFRQIASMADCRGDERILDLYCGTGSISFSICGRVKEVIGIDSETSAIDDAISNRELNGIANCNFYVADSLDYLKIAISQGTTFDIVIADPPRAGMHPKMIPLLSKLSPPRLIYVSCNPPALARDSIGLWEAGYILKDVVCIDMFPQTPHIESVALFTKT